MVSTQLHLLLMPALRHINTSADSTLDCCVPLQKNRKFPFSALTQSTADSADRYVSSEWPLRPICSAIFVVHKRTRFWRNVVVLFSQVHSFDAIHLALYQSKQYFVH